MTRKVAYGEGRDLLIAATVEVVAKSGLRGLTLRAVAAQAQVHNSLVGHHFGNRERLLAAALEWVVEQSIQVTSLYDFSSEEAFADAFIESFIDWPELHIFQSEMILESARNPIYREPVTRLYARYQEVVEESLEKIGVHEERKAVARRIFATLDGVVMQYMAGVEVEVLRPVIHDLWNTLRPTPVPLASPSPEQHSPGAAGVQNSRRTGRITG
ncbi:MAG: TetR/AcrR family transcriptional regulator [Leucobacter sp.]